VAYLFRRGGRRLADFEVQTPAGLKRKTPAAFQTTGVFLEYRKSADVQ
jgi:hypothetical protein